MPEQRDHELREAQLRFIGNILATLSHELKNHLAIIKEYSGLIQDLTEAEQLQAAGLAGQCAGSVRSIHHQIDKTLVLLRAFSRFSHRMDASQSVYSVNETVEELLALIHRIAHQRKIGLETDFGGDLPLVTGNPALLQFSLFCLIRDALGRLDQNGSLALKTRWGGEAVTITVAVRGTLRNKAEADPVCTGEARLEALELLGAGSFRSAGGEEATLTLPIAPPAPSVRTITEPCKEH